MLDFFGLGTGGIVAAKITQNTLIPISVAIACFGAGGAWIATTQKDVLAHTQSIIEIKKSVEDDRKEINFKLDKLTEQVSEIRGILRGRSPRSRESNGDSRF